jgi:hypothetical protein
VAGVGLNVGDGEIHLFVDVGHGKVVRSKFNSGFNSKIPISNGRGRFRSIKA